MQTVKNISTSTELLLRVAWEYYVNDRNQGDIARAYGISPASVSRLLKSGRAQGLVTITVQLPEGLCLETEAQLRQAFDLALAYVVPTSAVEDQLLGALGQAAAAYLSHHAHELPTIAVGWGRTISHIARHVPQQAESPGPAVGEVVEMVGTFLASSSQLQSLRLGAGLAQRLRRSAAVLAAPAVAPDPETCAALLRHAPIRDVLARARGADLAIASLGTVDPHSTLYQVGLLSPDDLARLQRRGAAGEMLGRFFDRDGRPVAFALDDRLIGLTLDDVRRLPRVLVVAGGEAKREAILAALRGGLVSHLVTDEETARAILAAEARRPAANGAGRPPRPRPEPRAVGEYPP